MTEDRFPERTVVQAELAELSDVQEPADAILIGGPGDRARLHAVDAAVVHVRDGDLVHRYIRTERQRDVDGRSLLVYNYDGEERG
jgi:hypothetical protein